MDYFNIANDRLDMQYYVDKLLSGHDTDGAAMYIGAITSCPELNKDANTGKTLKICRLDVHRTRAEQKMLSISTTMREKYPGIWNVVLVHRIGDLLPQDHFMFVGISARDKEQSFQALEYALEEMGKISVWREEVYEDNTRNWTSTHECFWKLTAQDRETLVSPPRAKFPPNYRGRSLKRNGGQRTYSVKTLDGKVMHSVPDDVLRTFEDSAGNPILTNGKQAL